MIASAGSRVFVIVKRWCLTWLVGIVDALLLSGRRYAFDYHWPNNALPPGVRAGPSVEEKSLF